MHLSFENLFPKLYNKVDLSSNVSENNVSNDNTETIFKLPIEYLEKKHTIPQSVITDLELIEGSQVASDIVDISSVVTVTPSMYFYLLNPGVTEEFSQKMLPKWSKYITSDLEFLKNTQYILKTENLRGVDISSTVIATQNTDVANIWKETKESVSSRFLEKYSYMDWKPLEFLNSSETFLNIVGLYNIISPVLSLLLPVILLITPFFLLRIRGIPIKFDLYIEILKDIAKHNMIGKTLSIFSNKGSISIDKIIYIAVSVFFYVMQTYQNTVCCIRFYNNTKKIRDYLRTMREFSERQIAQMKHFISNVCEAGSCISYSGFCEETKKHIDVLTRFHAELSNMEKSSSIWMIGKMMRCFYLLHKDIDYEKSLYYAIGFEGYILNLEGIRRNLSNNIIHFGNVSSAETTNTDKKRRSHITRQYYPPLIACDDIVPIKNTVILDKSMIITGPNASGKTTAIKTVLLNIIFTQQIGAGFYDKCNIIPYTHLHSYLNIPDTSNRDSLFQAEARRCKEIITNVSENGEENGSRHFAIFDELFSGTNAKESIKTGQSFLKYLEQRKHVNFVMTTHFTEICKNLKQNSTIKMIQMDTKSKENGEFEYTYKMKNGISNVLGAVKVLKEMDYPIEILNDFS